MIITARQIIDEARTLDARFFDLKVPDGALLLVLNTTQRRLLLRFADTIEPLIDQSVEVATQISGALVGVDDDGNPYYITTGDPGYPVFNSGTPTNVVPYVDFSGVPISADPFGETGDTPGFPLPSTLLKIIQVVARYSNGTVSDVDVIPERSRNNPNTHNLTAFINGNRLIPLRQPSVAVNGGWPDLWTSVTAVTLTYLGVPILASLDDTITIPVVLHEALTTAVAAHLATAVPPTTMSTAERASFAATAKRSEEDLRLIGTDVLNEVTQHSIIYHP